MLYEIMRSINNCFDIPGATKTGVFTIEDGVLEAGLQLDQFFIIEGSVFNDGLHQNGENDLTDETFSGSIRPLAIPRAFLKLAEEVEAWQEKYGDAAASPYNSESFAGYSYTKAAGSGSSESSGLAGWQKEFRSRLRSWRKL